MATQSALTSIAHQEFKALLHDARSAIHGLGRQRQSVLEALEAARAAGPEGDRREASWASTGLLDDVYRLENMLDRTLRELERIEVDQAAPGGAQPLAWTGWLTQAFVERPRVRG